MYPSTNPESSPNSMCGAHLFLGVGPSKWRKDPFWLHLETCKKGNPHKLTLPHVGPGSHVFTYLDRELLQPSKNPDDKAKGNKTNKATFGLFKNGHRVFFWFPLDSIHIFSNPVPFLVYPNI